MTIQRMVELLTVEHECMLRKSHSDCDSRCESCDLVQDDGELHEMYTDVIAILKAHEPRVLSVADIIDEGITPDVIWIERREEGDVAAGVWQIDHYEMVGGGVVDDLGEEIAEAPEAYNTRWRCWYPMKPTDEQRKEVQWDA